MNIAPYIEYAILKPTTTIAAVEIVCAEAKEHGFAVVCVPPLFVKKASALLTGSSIKLATVIGFPFGYSAIEAKIAEIVLAIIDGADELEMVINTSAVKNKDWQFLANEINTIMPIVRGKGKIIKLIIESSLLTDEEMITCCDIYGAAGVDAIVTGTGYAEKETTIETVQLLRKHLASAVKIKAGDGIKNYSFARQLIAAGAIRLGCSNSKQLLQELAQQN
jgi:deoxyribose-phosphate aldolase